MKYLYHYVFAAVVLGLLAGPIAAQVASKTKASIKPPFGSKRTLRAKHTTQHHRVTLRFETTRPDTIATATVTVIRDTAAAASPQLVNNMVGLNSHKTVQTVGVKFLADGSAEVGLPVTLCKNSVSLQINRDSGAEEVTSYEINRTRKPLRARGKRRELNSGMKQDSLGGKRSFERYHWARRSNGAFSYFVEFRNPNRKTCLAADIYTGTDYNLEITDSSGGMLLRRTRETYYTKAGAPLQVDSAFHHQIRLDGRERIRFRFWHNRCEESPYTPEIIRPIKPFLCKDLSAPTKTANKKPPTKATSPAPGTTKPTGTPPAGKPPTTTPPSPKTITSKGPLGNWRIGSKWLKFQAGTGSIYDLRCTISFTWKQLPNDYIEMVYTNGDCLDPQHHKPYKLNITGKKHKLRVVRLADGRLNFNGVVWEPTA